MSEAAKMAKMKAPSERLISLDVFRGLTIAGMVLVNNPGTWSAIYPPLEHAEWNGWTPTDLVFPFFLFIVGVSITLALSRRKESGGSQRDLFIKVARRAALIFLVGLALHLFPFFPATRFTHMRILGVLQRIALCYFFAAIIFLTTRVRTQAIIAVALLLIYWFLMTKVPVPGYGVGDLGIEGNLAAYLDRLLLAGHTYRPQYDPEGLLSTVPAISTTLFGVLTGHWLRQQRDALDKVAGLFVAGACGVVIGWAWNAWFPINKALWTSSYVVFTAGLALELLALSYWLIDIKGYRRWTKPFVIFGVNALAVFVLSALIVKLMALWKITRPDGSKGGLQGYIFQHVFASWASPINASLMYAICFVLVCFGAMALLYRWKIIIKL